MINVLLTRENILNLDVDCIVNAANSELQAGGGVCGAIFSAAGYYELQKECDAIGPIHTGEAVITKGYKLKAKHIIHAVGPIYRDDSSAPYLSNAYYNSLNLARDNGIKSIAFPSISTGIFGYPLDKAAKVVKETIEKWKLENSAYSIDIYLCCFNEHTYYEYSKLF